MLKERDLLPVIDEIYHASVLGDWKRVLRPVLDWTGSAAGAYLGVNKSTQTIAFCEVLGIPEPMLYDYDSEFVQRDPRVFYALENPALDITHDAQHMTSRKLWNDEYFDWLKGYGFRYYLSLRLIDTDDFVCHCSIQRSPSDGMARTKQLQAAELLLPHMRRGLILYRALVEKHAVAGGALDLLDQNADAVFFVAGDGRVVWRNDAAAAFLRNPDTVLEEHAGGLQPRCSDLASDWKQWLAQGAHAVGKPFATVQPRFLLRHPKSSQPVLAVMHPLPPQAGLFPELGLPTFALSVPAGRSDVVACTDMLRDLYGLTPRESELAILLGRGTDLNGAATRLGVTRETARSYLKAVLQKTGCKRQAELVALLASLGRHSCSQKSSEA